MKNVVFNGIGLSEKELFGIHRNTLSLLIELDKIVEKGTVKIITEQYRDNRNNDKLTFDNIELIRIPINWGRTGINKIDRILNKACILYVKRHFLKKYAKKTNSILVDTLLAFPKGSDVISIYDCIPELFPEYYNSFSLKNRRRRLISRQKKAIKNAKIVLTDSESAKKDIASIYNCNPDRIHVLSCGWQHFLEIKEDKSILEKYGLKEKTYYFSLGSRLQHKNTKWIISAAKQNPSSLFVVSGSTSLNGTDAKQIESGLKNVIFTGYVSDEQIKALMHFCKFFIQPSIYEGFGIPPMEAMSVGADCIVSNVGSLPEVYGNCVWYIDPRNYDDINIEKITFKPKHNNSIVLNNFSWEKSAKKLLSILRTLEE